MEASRVGALGCWPSTTFLTVFLPLLVLGGMLSWPC
jgi:hypothetical protein